MAHETTLKTRSFNLIVAHETTLKTRGKYFMNEQETLNLAEQAVQNATSQTVEQDVQPVENREVDNDVVLSNSEKPTEKTFTQQEVDEIVKSRIEREIKKLAAKAQEPKKLTEINEIETLKSELQETQKALQELTTQHIKTELRAKASDILNSNGIKPNDKMLDILVADDAETTHDNIKAFTDLLKTQAVDIVKVQMKGSTPVSTTANVTKTVTKAEIMAIKDVNERQKMIAENLHLFK